MKNKTYGLTHIAVSVKDLQQTKAFYQKVFDMEVMYDKEDFIQLTTPGCYDILVFEKGEGNTGSTGIAHFGFRLKDPKDISFMEKKISMREERSPIRENLYPVHPIFFSTILTAILLKSGMN